MGGGMGGGMGAFGDGSQSAFGGAPPSAMGMGQRPMSTFSMATSVNPFAGPSQNENPSEDELFNALRLYLSTQDLMTVTKKYVWHALRLSCVRADAPFSSGLRVRRSHRGSRKQTLVRGRSS